MRPPFIFENFRGRGGSLVKSSDDLLQTTFRLLRGGDLQKIENTFLNGGYPKNPFRLYEGALKNPRLKGGYPKWIFHFGRFEGGYLQRGGISSEYP